MSDADYAEHNHTPRIVFSWLVVSIPLAYGIYNAIKASLQLLSG